MHSLRRTSRARRAAAGAVSLLAVGLALAPAGAQAASGLALIPAGAQAASSSARLSVRALRVSDGTLDARQRFTVSGVVANRGDRVSPAQLQLTLQSSGNPTVIYALGGLRLDAIRGGRARSFSAKVSAPALRQAAASGWELRVCVRPRRGSASVACARGGRRLRIAPATPAPRVPAPPARPAPPTPPAPPVPNPPAPPAPPAPDPTVYTPGARTLGDSLFPTIGNGGYDAQHYDLQLSYTNLITRVLRGTATIEATATQNLSDFSFDFQNLAVSSVSVDGQPATFAYDFDASKLIVTPAAGIRTGTGFTVTVAYGGSPGPVIDPDGSAEGWLTNIDYGAVALGEPLGSQGWFPCNDVPTDKATFDITVTAAPGLSAVSNGVLAETTANDDGTTTYDWIGEQPMAPYLATVSVGDFDTSGSDFSDPARPLYVYVDRSFVANRATIVANQQRVPGILDFYAGYYGVPYPFSAAGGIVPRVGADVGYVLETQTKPTYPSEDPDSDGVGIETIAHENAHQWFGDLVTLGRWRDIWLNEGITEFSSWLWSAAQPGGATLTRRFDAIYAGRSPTFWNIAPADPPTAADIFDGDAMYDRGAMTMTAIRQIFIDAPGLGEGAFRTMMGSWLTDHAYGNVTTPDLIALVQATDPTRADRWAEFFDEWLYTSYEGDPALPGNKPSITPATF